MIHPTTTSWHEAALDGARVGHSIEAHDTIGSTNDRARELLETDAPDGIAVVAEVQTAGRGRMGRGWTSPPGVNLTVSVGLRPALRAEDAWQIGLAAALAVHVVASRVADVALKWPNDVVARDGRKVAGMLVELASEAQVLRHAVLGIGINVNWSPGEMPTELAETAVSLSSLAGRHVDRVRLLRDLLAALDDEVGRLEAGDSPLARYRAACTTLGRPVGVETPSGRLDGVATDLDERGALIVRTGDGRDVRVSSGEVVRVRAARPE